MTIHSKSRTGAVLASAAVLAVFTAGGAVAHGLVTSQDIKDETIVQRDIRSGGVGSSEVVDGSLDVFDLNDGTQDLVNSVPRVIYVDRYITADSDAGRIESAKCPPESQVLSGFVIPRRNRAGEWSLRSARVNPEMNAYLLDVTSGDLRVRVVCLKPDSW